MFTKIRSKIIEPALREEKPPYQAHIKPDLRREKPSYQAPKPLPAVNRVIAAFYTVFRHQINGSFILPVKIDFGGACKLSRCESRIQKRLGVYFKCDLLKLLWG